MRLMCRRWSDSLNRIPCVRSVLSKRMLMQCRIKQHTMTQEERVAAEASQQCVAPVWNACMLRSRWQAECF